MAKIDALELGATLFVPATHHHTQSIANQLKFSNLKSVVFDTEDGINSDELDNALTAISVMLPRLKKGKLLRFIRPRNVEVLKQILQFNAINNIDGFVLPKFGLNNSDKYLSCFSDELSQNFSPMLMPSIEGEELFDISKLQQLREKLLPFKEQIITVRFGAEDMMHQLGLRRDCHTSLYDMCAPSQVIANLLMVFKPHGFNISAPVFRCYKDKELYAQEITRDLQEGLISKTIIHPEQIEPLHQLYRVQQHIKDEAEAIIKNSKAVFALNNTMAERSTQQRWATQIIQRAELYGILDER